MKDKVLFFMFTNKNVTNVIFFYIENISTQFNLVEIKALTYIFYLELFMLSKL